MFYSELLKVIDDDDYLFQYLLYERSNPLFLELRTIGHKRVAFRTAFTLGPIGLVLY